MSKILFVTSRNILTTSGELRLVKNRAESLFESYQIVTDFLVWQTKERIMSTRREKILAGGSMELVEFSVFEFLKGYREIERKINQKLDTAEYKMIVLSGFLMSSYAFKIKKKYDVKVAIDVHGALEDVKELAREASLKRRIKSMLIYYVDDWCLNKNFKNIDYCIVVSEALKEYLNRRYSRNEEMKYIVVPCALNYEDVSPDNYLQARKKYRNKYKLKDRDVVFVYSGGISKWQCIQETIDLYEKISAVLSNAKLLVFSHDIDYIKGLTENSSVVFDSYPPEELEDALCAGDFAFLVRKDCITNNVAFPNKYLEYVKSGMNIISTPYVYEISRQIEEYDIGYLYEFENDIGDILNYIKITSKKHTYESQKIIKILEYNSFSKNLKCIEEIVNR